MRKVLITAAVLVAACTQNQPEAPVAPPTTEPASDLIVSRNDEVVAETTTTLALTTTTGVPVTTTTVAPELILCANLPHPEHHSPCPPQPARNLQPVTTLPVVERSPSSQLASIRACESGGDYTAVSPNGLYYGAYQFHHQTWASVGGSGNPAHASPSEQDMRAQMMIDAGRRGEWPNC